jgi:HEAT repeat protein
MLRLGEGAQALPQPGYITPRLMLNDTNPRVRAKGIEIIDAQMIGEKEDPDVAEKVLEGFLEDKNNRVRANAARALYKYRPDMAFEMLEKMLKSDDKWMKVSAIWVLGELEGDRKAAQLLLDNIKESDFHFKRRLVKSLQKLAQSEKGLPEEINKKIKKAMERISVQDPKII